MRQRVQLFIDVRQHIFRQRRPQRLCKCIGVQIARIDADDPVAHCVVEADGVVQALDAVERHFNFAQLNAVAHVLDLPVAAGKKIEIPVLPLHGHIARAVENVAVIGAERVLDKGGIGLFCVGKISRRKSGAAHA